METENICSNENSISYKSTNDYQRRSFSINSDYHDRDDFYSLANHGSQSLQQDSDHCSSIYSQRSNQPAYTTQTKADKDKETGRTGNQTETLSLQANQCAENSTKPAEQKSPGSNASCISQNSAGGSSTSSEPTPVQVPQQHGVSGGSGHTSRPLQAMIPTCIYLMSRVAIRLEVEDTASCPARVMAAAALHADDLGVANRALAAAVFCLWMTSPLLEVQLKPLHRPFEVRRAWPILLDRFSHGTANQHARDEPIISLQRNVFFPKQNEDKIKDPKIIELLYEEARHNVLGGRYPCEPTHCIMLGGIQARIELGPYNLQAHTTSFFREKQGRFLPAHVRKSESWAWLPISSKHSAEVRLLEQFKRVPNAATTRKLMRKYLEFCWALPFYGSAFFQGQVEQPVRGLTSLITHQDIPVLVAINQQGIYIIDDLECTLLLGLRYPELSWDFAKPSREELPECLPCLFLQFAVLENGARVYKVLQIFSRQAAMMDVLISSFIEEMKKARANGTIDEPDRTTINFENDGTEANGEGSQGQSCLSNKLSRLTLATFDEEGRCIGQMGSFSFSY